LTPPKDVSQDRILFCHMFYFLVPLLLLLASFLCFLLCIQSFTFLTVSLNKFLYYREARTSLVYLQYFRLMTNSTYANDTILDNLKTDLRDHVKGVFEIFTRNSPPILPSQIAPTWNTLNGNICAFDEAFNIVGSPSCAIDALRTFLSQGLDTVLIYISNHLDTLLVSSTDYHKPPEGWGVNTEKQNISFADLVDQTSIHFEGMYALEASTKVAIDFALEDILSVVGLIRQMDNWLAAAEGMFVLFFLGFVIFKLVFYLRNQKEIFNNVFLFLSLKTIVENERLLHAIQSTAISSEKPKP
jgi:hypothetical protein